MVLDMSNGDASDNASSVKGDWIDSGITDYIATHTEPADDILADLRAETAELGRAKRMQVDADQGALLSLFTRLTGALNAVEIGTFTGYSSICIARALAPGGHLTCFDVSEEFTSVARRYWERAGLDDRITLVVGEALDRLGVLPDERIDLVFIDADKPNYVNYYEALVPRLRTGGLILVDNTLWSGRVVERSGQPIPDDESTAAIAAFNDHVAADARVASYILPVADGLTLVVRR